MRSDEERGATSHLASRLPVVGDMVRRPRLERRLEQSAPVRIVLVCAPAGYGKTSLVATWVREWTRDPRRRVAWVQTPRGPAAGSALWHELTDALRRPLTGRDSDATAVDPLSGLAAEAEAELAEIALLLSHTVGLVEREVPDRLGRVLAGTSEELVVVLDDFHHVSDAGQHALVRALIESASSSVRFIIITRHDPPWSLPRMRLEGNVHEVRMSDLAFNGSETAELFDRLGIATDDEQLGMLLDRTEGWAAGLRLAALGAASARDPGAFLARVSGTDRYIADYLMLEVYQALSEQWRDFLCRVGIVDEICADLAVHLGAGVDSEHRLRELAGTNAFIYETSDRSGWYRLHPLLVDFLRSRIIDRQQERALHDLASGWFVAQEQPREALRHTVAAHNWDTAGDLVGTHLVTWAVRSEPTQLIDLLTRAPREAILTRPGLATGLAAAYAMSGQTSDLPELLEAARSRLADVSADHRRRYDFILTLIEVGSRRWVGDLHAVLEGYRAMPSDPTFLSQLGLTDWVALRTLLLSNIGTCELWTGDYQRARQHLTEAGRLDGGRPLVLPTRNAQSQLAYLDYLVGDLSAAEQGARQALDGFRRAGIPTAIQARSAHLALAGVGLDRDDLDLAAAELAHADGIGGELQTDLATDVMRSRLLAARGDIILALTAAQRVLEAAAESLAPDHLVQSVRAWVAELRDLDPTADGASPPAEDPDAAPGSVRATVSLHLRRAREAALLDETSAALDHLDSAILVAAPEQLRGPFLLQGCRKPLLAPLLTALIERGTAAEEFAQDLLARLPSEAKRAVDSLVLVPLSERESAVLRLLGGTMTLQEVADRLFISVNTVKTHQRGIYAKLGATTRREAVVRARDLGLI